MAAWKDVRTWARGKLLFLSLLPSFSLIGAAARSLPLGVRSGRMSQSMLDQTGYPLPLSAVACVLSFTTAFFFLWAGKKCTLGLVSECSPFKRLGVTAQEIVANIKPTVIIKLSQTEWTNLLFDIVLFFFIFKFFFYYILPPTQRISRITVLIMRMKWMHESSFISQWILVSIILPETYICVHFFPLRHGALLLTRALSALVKRSTLYRE